MRGKHKPAGPVATFIFGIIFLVAGGAIAYFLGWPMIVEAKASKAWPSTPGTITVSQVESHRGSDNKTMYSHRVEYTFAVDGVQHTGNRVWVNDGWSSSSSSSAKRTVSQYPVGGETTVYYDPAAPEVCALQPGTTWFTYLPLAFGGLFFLVGTLIVGGAVVKLLAAGLMIGTAAILPTNQNYASTMDRPRSDAEIDDGIDIS
jgi:hypothetical protein